MNEEQIWTLFKELDEKLGSTMDTSSSHYSNARAHLLNARMLYVHSLFFDDTNYGFK